MDKNDLPKEVKEKINGKELERVMVKVEYKNWKGETGIRFIIPLNIFYGNTEYHKEEQWLMKVWDLDKKDYRTYALRDVLKWIS